MDDMSANTGGPNPDDPFFQETITRFWFLEQHISVDECGVKLGVSPLGWGDRHVPADRIDDVTVTKYSPSTYGGWHWGFRRTPGGNAVYRLSGRDGVELELDDGTRLFIGSASPTGLKTAIERSVRG